MYFLIKHDIVTSINKHKIIFLHHNLPWKNKNSWLFFCVHSQSLLFSCTSELKRFYNVGNYVNVIYKDKLFFVGSTYIVNYIHFCLQYKNYSENKEIIVFESFSELLLYVCISFANELLGVNSIVLSFTVTCKTIA